MLGQVSRHFRREEGICLEHALGGVFEARVAARLAELDAAHLLDPVLHAPVSRAVLLEGRAPALDRDELVDALGDGAGVLERDGAAERVADDGERRAFDLVDEGGDVERELGDRVHAADRPGAVAVAAKVRRVDGIAVDETFGDEVPVAGVVLAAVDQEQRRLTAIAPDDVVELHALRFVIIGAWFDHVRSPMTSASVA